MHETIDCTIMDPDAGKNQYLFVANLVKLHFTTLKFISSHLLSGHFREKSPERVPFSHYIKMTSTK